MAREQIVHNEIEACPYLDGQRARMPLRWQYERLSGDQFDRSLAEGDRRVGQMLYRTQCPSCQACEPLRIPVQSFAPSKSQRKLLKRNRDLSVSVGPATFSEEKLALFNRHKFERGLAKRDAPMSAEGYYGWFLRTCTQTVEMKYLDGDRLVGVGILDVGRTAISSVYFFFDPDVSKRSLGTMSVLAEAMWWRQQGGIHHYLGLYVGDCRHLSYKARFHPHERLIHGTWTRVERGDRSTASLAEQGNT